MIVIKVNILIYKQTVNFEKTCSEKQLNFRTHSNVHSSSYKILSHKLSVTFTVQQVIKLRYSAFFTELFTNSPSHEYLMLFVHAKSMQTMQIFFNCGPTIVLHVHTCRYYDSLIGVF